VSSVLAIGNGESRSQLDLKLFLPSFISVGCNAIARDHIVDHLICVDRRMVKEALETPLEKIYTRFLWLNNFSSQKVLAVPELPYQGDQRADEPFHWGSGPYAVLLAAQLAKTEVWMIGFDLYDTNKKVNNVYKGTDNYLKADARSVDPSYWIHQTAKVFECFPNIHFKIFNNENWMLPEKWKKSNVEVLTYKYFRI
jgi:hypothetical protein